MAKSAHPPVGHILASGISLAAGEDASGPHDHHIIKLSMSNAVP